MRNGQHNQGERKEHPLKHTNPQQIKEKDIQEKKQKDKKKGEKMAPS